jgi:hypothetical protein
MGVSWLVRGTEYFDFRNNNQVPRNQWVMGFSAGRSLCAFPGAHAKVEEVTDTPFVTLLFITLRRHLIAAKCG